MRTKNVLRNNIYSITSYLLIFILGIVSRKIFLKYLNIEFLGYEGLFSNIFALLSLAELGVGTVITYSLYQEVASKNEEQITKLMMMYKYMYRIIGIVVGAIGLILLPFLKHIITDNVTNWSYIRIIFILQLLSTLCTYFLSYKRVIYIVDQKQFICVKVDTIISIVSQVLKIVVLIVLQNYIIYLIISIINNILANIIISYKCKNDYPYIKKTAITRQDFVERNFFKDIKNFMIHKIAYIVYGGVDNIIISTFLGISSVGMISNYLVINGLVRTIIDKIILPIQASIGNLIYQKDEDERGKTLLFSLELGLYFIASFSSISYIVLIQPIIELWIGKEYILSMSFVIALSINSYIGYIHIIICYYRNTFGEYQKDRKFMALAAIVNLVISLIFVRIWGITGVVIGTAIGHAVIWCGRVSFVFTTYLKTSYAKYIIKQLIFISLTIVEGVLTYWLSKFIPISTVGLLGRLVLCLIIPNFLNFLVFYKTKDFEIIKIYLNQILKLILYKAKEKSN